MLCVLCVCRVCAVCRVSCVVCGLHHTQASLEDVKAALDALQSIEERDLEEDERELSNAGKIHILKQVVAYLEHAPYSEVRLHDTPHTLPHTGRMRVCAMRVCVLSSARCSVCGVCDGVCTELLTQHCCDMCAAAIQLW
jgi:hypothetical protein